MLLWTALKRQVEIQVKRSLPGARAAAYAKEARDARLLARRAGLEPAGRVAAVAPHLSRRGTGTVNMRIVRNSLRGKRSNKQRLFQNKPQEPTRATPTSSAPT